MVSVLSATLIRKHGPTAQRRLPHNPASRYHQKSCPHLPLQWSPEEGEREVATIELEWNLTGDLFWFPGPGPSLVAR